MLVEAVSTWPPSGSEAAEKATASVLAEFIGDHRAVRLGGFERGDAGLRGQPEHDTNSDGTCDVRDSRFEVHI